MACYCENIYKTARKRAGITVEYAAELLCVNPRTLYKYESGELIPAIDIVKKMCTMYGTPYLRIQHMNAHDEHWRDLVPHINEQNVAISTLAFLDELNAIEDHKAMLIEIARDGVISDSERDKWERILEAVFRLIKAGYDLKYSNSKKEE